MSAKHPAIEAGCTSAQVAAFERIAIGDTGGHAPRTLAALADKKLIEFIIHESSDRLGKLRWTEPQVPLHHHVAWCAWCSENVKDEA